MKLLQIGMALVTLGGLACHSDTLAKTANATLEPFPAPTAEPAPSPAAEPAKPPPATEAPKPRPRPNASHSRSVAAPIEIQLGNVGLTGFGDTDIGRATGIENRPLVDPGMDNSVQRGTSTMTAP